MLEVSVSSRGGHFGSGQRPPESFLAVPPNMSDRTRWKRDDISTSSSSRSSSSSSSINKRVDSPKYTSVTLPQPSILTPFPRFVPSIPQAAPRCIMGRPRFLEVTGLSELPDQGGGSRTSTCPCWVPSFLLFSAPPPPEPGCQSNPAGGEEGEEEEEETDGGEGGCWRRRHTCLSVMSSVYGEAKHGGRCRWRRRGHVCLRRVLKHYRNIHPIFKLQTGSGGWRCFYFDAQK